MKNLNWSSVAIVSLVVLTSALTAHFLFTKSNKAKTVEQDQNGRNFETSEQSSHQENESDSSRTIESAKNSDDEKQKSKAPLNSASAQSTIHSSRMISSTASFDLKKFKARFPGAWELVQSNGSFPETLNGMGPKIDPSAPENVLGIASEIASYFGIGSTEIRPILGPNQKSQARAAFRFEQFLEGLPVYQGSFAVFANLPGGEISLIQNSLHPVSEIAKGPMLTRSSAEATYQASGAKGVRIVSSTGPVYFVNSGVARLAWLVIEQAPSASFEEEVVVDGSTGKELYRRPLGSF